MDVSSFSTVALLVAFLYAAQNLLRYLKAADWNGVLGILIAAVTGIGAVMLAAHSDALSNLHLITGGAALGTVNGATQIFLGVSVGSAGTVLADARKAFDNSDTADKPKLVDPPA